MRVHVGMIGVDAGLCWIGDPCYIHHDKNPKEWGKDWGEFCANLHKKESRPGPTLAQFNYDKGHAGLGVCVSTGLGDRAYDVHAEVNGKRIVSATVTFMKNEERLGEMYGGRVPASLLVAYLHYDLIGEKVSTPSIGDWDGGECEITQLFPEELDTNIVMRVKRISDGEEIGILHDERVTLLEPEPS